MIMILFYSGRKNKSLPKYMKDESNIREVKYIEIPRIETKRTSKIQNPKDKTITRNKETQMTGQHGPI